MKQRTSHETMNIKREQEKNTWHIMKQWRKLRQAWTLVKTHKHKHRYFLSNKKQKDKAWTKARKSALVQLRRGVALNAPCQGSSFSVVLFTSSCGDDVLLLFIFIIILFFYFIILIYNKHQFFFVVVLLSLLLRSFPIIHDEVTWP